MKKKELFVVEEQKVCGINKPQVILKIKGDSTNYDFKVTVDGKDTKYDIFSIDSETFVFNINVCKDSKMIKVYAIKGKKSILIVSIENKLILRLKEKLLEIIRRFVAKFKLIMHVLYKGIKFLWREYHFLVPPSMWKKYFKDFKCRINGTTDRFYNPFYVSEYNKWLKENTKETEYKELKYQPKISILIPVYNIERRYLAACLDSILSQIYDNYEVCLVDDHSTLEETKSTLTEYKNKDKRIKVKYRSENGHISRTTNDALKMATGDFVALMDDDDLLTPDALYKVVSVLNKNKSLDLIYSDEDKLNPKGLYCDPNFKPDFSPDTLLSLNYICHLVVLRRKIVEEVGGFTVGLEGAQDHDLLLKVTEKTNKIYHIPEILYHWRMIEGSTSMTISNKSYATDKGKLAIENALARRNIKGTVEKDELSTYYRVYYTYEKEPKISIIIPTRDYVDILKTCIDSIYEKTNYKNYEIIIANNDSKEKKTLDFFDEYKKKYKNFKVVDCIMEFNYSRINNIAVEKATGEYIVLLNNDTEVITGDWLKIMVGYAMQKHIGAVGPKLLYPDETVQHGGVILGLGGVASHAYIGATRDDFGMYGRLRVPYNYSACTAACLMIKKTKFLEVGGLEENLKVAYNDIDFNIKLLGKGYYNVFLPNVELLHYESKSRGLDTTSEKYKRFQLEEKYMYDKWKSKLTEDRFYNPNFSKKGWFMLDKADKKKKQ